MTKQELVRLNINYDLEMGVVFHWSKNRGWCPLKRNVQNDKKSIYYVFKHNKKTVAVREDVIIKAFKEGD